MHKILLYICLDFPSYCKVLNYAHKHHTRCQGCNNSDVSRQQTNFLSFFEQDLEIFVKRYADDESENTRKPQA